MGAAQLLFHQMNDVGLKKSLNCYLVHFPICHKKQSSDLRANHEMQYKWLSCVSTGVFQNHYCLIKKNELF